MVGLGRRNAHQRIAHLICELFIRATAAGLTEDRRYPFTLTQAELGDALGLTDVHVNRVLKNLRENGLLSIRQGAVTIMDWNTLNDG
ncbi:MAG: winged helix-turn-helix domain-containing protein [Alphaproteobacteria bacterium]|nr:winged helix-turn-helix domain-containing protein [Alphaproteobacteria bacterium]